MLFNIGHFPLHAGGFSNFKIDCDYLTDEDIDAIANQLTIRLPGFSIVEGIPRGGLRLAEAMRKYAIPYQPIRHQTVLIVDDVWTTGMSMEKQRDFRTGVIGAVIFARSDTPEWVTPLFRLEP